MPFVAGQLKLGGLDDAQLKEAAATATVVGALSTWFYGIEYDRKRFDQELERSAAHMSSVLAGSRG